MLRAVAIENSKDSQVAAAVVVEEIIPFLSVQSGLSNSANEINSCSSGGSLSVYIRIYFLMYLLYGF